jgi:uncharacterized glyoxalase superfamily protein PhnB
MVQTGRAGQARIYLGRPGAGHEVPRAQDPAGTVHHAKLRIGDSIIAIGEAHGPYQPMPLALHFYVPDTDAAYKRALEAGAISIDEPVDQDYGDRYAGVKDPFGNVWYIATHLRDFTIPSEPPAPAKAQPQESEVEPHRRATKRRILRPMFFIAHSKILRAFPDPKTPRSSFQAPT